MRDAAYDGPGTYEVTVRFAGSARIQVEALNRSDAERRAMDAGVDPDDVEVEDAHCLYCIDKALTPDLASGDRQRLTGLEEAFFAITGRVPNEAIARLAAIDALEEAVA